MEKGALYKKVPVYREISGDLITPISALHGFMKKDNIFLLESALLDSSKSRYTFIGHSPAKTILYEKGCLKVIENGNEKEIDQNPIKFLKDEIKKESDSSEKYGSFCGGYVGFAGYDMVNHMGLIRKKVRESKSPSLVFLKVNDFYVFDNFTGKLYACSVTEPGINPHSYEDAVERTFLMAREIGGKNDYCRDSERNIEISNDFGPEEYTKTVRSLKEDIKNGECIQAVLSSLYTIEKKINPLTLYRVMRNINPSPYMFFLKKGNMVVCGTSPETHLRIKENTAYLKPIAGTAPVKKGHIDEASEKLLNDRKERSEHLMLVDLARNDLNRGCKTGSVEVSRFFEPEVYSHVIHIVSEVKGEIRDDVTPFELFCSTFPAGTVTGAPKVRAMELIDEYEKSPRGWYAGCAGYFSYSGDIDTCITIRSACVFEDRVELRAGAGIVDESIPENEFNEVHLKLSALFESLGKIQSLEEEYVFDGR